MRKPDALLLLAVIVVLGAMTVMISPESARPPHVSISEASIR